MAKKPPLDPNPPKPVGRRNTSGMQSQPTFPVPKVKFPPNKKTPIDKRYLA